MRPPYMGTRGALPRPPATGTDLGALAGWVLIFVPVVLLLGAGSRPPSPAAGAG